MRLYKLAILATIVLAIWLVDEVGQANGADAGGSASALYGTPDEWIPKLEMPLMVRFAKRQKLPGSDDLKLSDDHFLEMMGPLKGDSKIEVRLELLNLIESLTDDAKAAQRKAEESQTIHDYSDVMEALYYQEKMIIALKQLEEGKYWTMDPKGRKPPVPKGYVSVGLFGMGKVNGNRVFVLFPIHLSGNPRLRELIRVHEETEQQYLTAYAREFNSLTVENRIERIRAHTLSSRALSDRENLLPSGTEEENRMNLLDARFLIDRESNTLSIKFVRNEAMRIGH